MKTLTVKLPEGFDPARHTAALVAKIAERHGPGWEVTSIDETAGVAMASQRSPLASVTAEAGGPDKLASLPVAVSASQGDYYAALFAEQFPGYSMVDFDPHLRTARLAHLTEAELACRGAVAVACSVKPWRVKVRSGPGGGFQVGLPDPEYVPSKHDAKLLEVATQIVGQLGWRAVIDAKARTAQFVPGDPPLFPQLIPYPMDVLGPGDDWNRTRFGATLPQAGVGVGELVDIDWTTSQFALVAGMPNSGKTVAINAIVAQQLAAGAQLVVIDDPAKAIDFEWCKPYVMAGGWGCESYAHAAAALETVYEMGKARVGRLRDHGVVNWFDLPRDVQASMPPILIVVDELSALLVPNAVPKGVEKDNPVVIRNVAVNAAKAVAQDYLNRIIAELRFVGVRAILATQVTNARTGLPPSMKNKVGHRILAGTNPSLSARTQAFNDAATVPDVPEHVKASGANSRGVGVCDIEGGSPAVFKSLFARPADYAAALARLGVPVCAHPDPDPDLVAQYAARIPDEGTGNLPARRRGSGPVTGEDGVPLTGFEKANAARHALAGTPGRPTKAEREERGYAARSGEVETQAMAVCDEHGGFVDPRTGRCPGCR